MPARTICIQIIHVYQLALVLDFTFINISIVCHVVCTALLAPVTLYVLYVAQIIIFIKVSAYQHVHKGIMLTHQAHVLFAKTPARHATPHNAHHATHHIN